MPDHSNLFAEIPTELPQELIQTLLSSPTFRIERIVSKGHTSEVWYDQEENKRVLLVASAARIQFDDNTVELKPGDFVNSPATHAIHHLAGY